MACPAFLSPTPLTLHRTRRNILSIHMCTAPGPVPIPPSLAGVTITGVGLACVDLVATVASFPAPDAKIRTTTFAEHGGGNAANAIVAARRLGVSAALVSALGSDYRGKWARNGLISDGVDVTGVREIAAVHTPFSYIIVDAGRGTRTCIHTPDPRCTLADIDESALHAVQRSEVLLLDGRYPEAAIVAAKAARESGTFVLLDAERVREDTEKLVQLANGVVVKDACARELAGAASGDDVEHLIALLHRGPQWVVATRGQHGCVLVRRADAEDEMEVEREVVTAGLTVRRRRIGNVETVYCDAVSGVSVVDATGAGDAFLGAMAYGVATRLPLHRAIALASVAGAECCKGAGARASPRRECIADVIDAVHASGSVSSGMAIG